MADSKNAYEAPTAEVVLLNAEDVIMASGDITQDIHNNTTEILAPMP